MGFKVFDSATKVWGYCDPPARTEQTFNASCPSASGPPAPPATLAPSTDCEAEGGKCKNCKCKFPFKHEGTTYKGCTKAQPHGAKGHWCRTMDDGWGYCRTKTCPMHTFKRTRN